MSEIASKYIPFSPPDITESEIEAVCAALRSGWITTGKRTKLLEQRIADYVNVEKAVCLNSATAAMELTLRILGVGEGDDRPHNGTGEVGVGFCMDTAAVDGGMLLLRIGFQVIGFGGSEVGKGFLYMGV